MSEIYRTYCDVCGSPVFTIEGQQAVHTRSDEGPVVIDEGLERDHEAIPQLFCAHCGDAQVEDYGETCEDCLDQEMEEDDPDDEEA